ncbi:MAG: hypothetical protein ACRCVT_02090 [Leadbetterella sp.]
MNKLLFIFGIIFSLSSFAQETKWASWSKQYKGQKNYFPEYGNSPKNKNEIKSDNEFIESIKKQGLSNKDGAKMLASKGWELLKEGNLENAMLRFNQAWLLDNSNTNALWGFGTILGTLQNPDDGNKYLELAYKLDNSIHRLLIDIANGYLIKYYIKNDKNALNIGLSRLLEYNKIDGKNEESLYKTAIFYFHLEDYKSSWLYINECKKNGGGVIQKGFLDALSSKMKAPSK